MGWDESCLTCLNNVITLFLLPHLVAVDLSPVLVTALHTMTGVSCLFSCSCPDRGFWRLHNTQHTTRHAEILSDPPLPTPAALRALPQLFSKKFLVSFRAYAATAREIFRKKLNLQLMRMIDQR